VAEALTKGSYSKRSVYPSTMKSGRVARLPILTPSSPAASARLKLQKSRDTTCELALRSRLHRLGLRFRVHRKLLPNLRRTADIVFGPTKIAVFVDGCFWHGCTRHIGWPKSNVEWWKRKIRNNIVRDKDTNRLLNQAGWTVIRVWEHDDPSIIAPRIMRIINKKKQKGREATLQHAS
jgi:DNA mismatch endonuclease (patch repair protein)